MGSVPDIYVGVYIFKRRNEERIVRSVASSTPTNMETRSEKHLTKAASDVLCCLKRAVGVVLG